ncbi:MAG: hypothetical protein Q4E75_03440 [bacterium]|nr:hypothetical protein [bacterium]
MKGLIKNYLDNLSISKLNEFAVKNEIYLDNNDLEYILSLAKNNYEDILKDDKKYLDLLKNRLSKENYEKVKDLFLYYKNRYNGYLI